MAVEKVRFNPVNITNANLLALRPSNIDTSGGFPDLGKKILSALEPEFKQRAQEAGAIAGASTQVIKNEDGSYSVPPVPEAGTEYQTAFRDAMQTNYRNQIYFDYTKQVDQLMADNPRDPEAFRAKAEGAAAGILKTIPPEISAVIQPYLNQEILQRYSGIVSRKTSDERAALLTGLNEQETAYINNGSRLIRAGKTAEGEEQYRLAMETHMKYRSLVNATDNADVTALGTTITMQREIAQGQAVDDAIARRERALSIQERQARREADVVAAANKAKVLGLAQGIIPHIRAATDEQLFMLDRFAKQNVAPDEVLTIGPLTMTVQQFNDAVPDMDMFRSAVGTTINAEIADRRDDAVRKADEARKLEFRTKLEEVVNTGVGSNDPTVRDAINDHAKKFDGNTLEGRGALVNLAAETGIVPDVLINKLSLAARTTDPDPQVRTAVLFDAVNAWEMLGAATRNDISRPGSVVNQGAILRSQIPPDVNRALMLVSKMRESYGIMPSVAQRAIEIFQSGAERLTPEQVQSRIPNYGTKSNDLIREAFGLAEDKLAPIYIKKEFDDRYNLFAQAFDPEQALAITTESLKAEYEVNPIFVGGIGPSSFHYDMPIIAVQRYVRESLPLIDVDFTKDLGTRIRVQRSPASSYADPAYLFTYTDPVGVTQSSMTIRRSQLPDVKVTAMTAEERRDALILAAENDYIKAALGTAGNMYSPAGNIGAAIAAGVQRDERIRRANERYAQEKLVTSPAAK